MRHLFLAIIQRAFAFELLELKVSMMNIVTPIRTLYIQHIHNNRQPFRRFILISKDTIYDVASFIIASIYLVCLRNDLFELVFTRMCVCVCIYMFEVIKKELEHIGVVWFETSTKIRKNFHHQMRFLWKIYNI